jgi:hypothetical protein
MLYPYPPDLPTAELMQIVIDALRGKVPDPHHAFHCAWHVAGYAASLLEGQPLVVGDAPAIDDEEAATLLEGGISHGGIPWSLLLPILLRLMERLLNG